MCLQGVENDSDNIACQVIANYMVVNQKTVIVVEICVSRRTKEGECQTKNDLFDCLLRGWIHLVQINIRIIIKLYEWQSINNEITDDNKEILNYVNLCNKTFDLLKSADFRLKLLQILL